MPSSLDVAALLPFLLLVLGALLLMLSEVFLKSQGRGYQSGLAIAFGLAAALAAPFSPERAIFGGQAISDGFSGFVAVVVCAGLVLSVLLGRGWLEQRNIERGEYYALVLFALAGMMLMAVAADLLIIFLALEVFSLALYVLTGLRRKVFASTEGAFKYFVLGGFSSAFFLYGIAFTYGLVGSTHLDRVTAAIQAQSLTGNPLLLVAMGLLLVGFAFKVAAVPFHMWTPDAYEGAPTIVTGFMSTAVKAAAFAAFARVFLSALEPLRGEWAPVLWVLAVCTMILGAVVGVAQTNLKRMLAYSSIAHGGYLLVALVSGSDVGKASILFYLVVYAVTNLGAFAIIALLSTRETPMEHLDDYKGLWFSSPVMAGVLTVFLLSLGGFPPTAGFVAKWYVFSAAVRAGQYSLAIVGVLTSVVSVFFYLRIVVMMYMSDRAEGAAPPQPSRTALAALAVSVAILLYLGVLPTRLLDLAARSVALVF